MIYSGSLVNYFTTLPATTEIYTLSLHDALPILNLINQGTVMWKDGQLLNGGQPATVVSNGGQWLMTGDNSFNAYSAQTNPPDRKSTRLNPSHQITAYADICYKKIAFNPGGVVDV